MGYLSTLKSIDEFFFQENELDSSSGHDEHKKLLMELRNSVQPSSRILEIACGTANSLLSLATHIPFNFKVTGIDIVDIPIDKAREIASRRNIQDQCQFYVGDVFELPLYMSPYSLDLYEQNFPGRLDLNVIDLEELMKIEENDLNVGDERDGEHQREESINTLKSQVGNSNSSKFDFIYDCQCWHLLRHYNENRLIKFYTHVLKRNGLLFMLAGRDDPELTEEERSLGMPRVQIKDIERAFCSNDWGIMSIDETLFDETEFYATQRPLYRAGWQIILKRK